MKLFTKGFIVFIFFLFCFGFFASPAFALTTPFRSASIVSTDGTVPFANLGNCSVTDGQTCDRIANLAYANLYFQNFGSYSDFGMPIGSTITKVRIRVTGKTSWAYYIGLSLQMPVTSNCQFPSDLWTGYLGGSAINVQNFVTDVTPFWYSSVSVDCLAPYNFENKMTWRINYYSPGISWSANIDNFEIAFDYNPGPTPTSAPTPTPALTPTPTLISTPSPPLKTPLILIPGIAGSELKTAEETPWVEDDGHGFVYTHIYPKDETVWVEIKHALMPGNDDYFDILRMDKTGKLSMANLALTGNLFSGIYQGAINFFTSNGYELNKDLFLFPYDWRKDISETKVFLDQEIQQIKAKTGSAKVDIVAHSMGGLVARNYIADPEEAKNVRKLFTLGTPHLGAVAFLKNLRFGGCLTKQGRLTELAENNICLGISSSEVKDIVQNMIGAYELAPTRKYFDFYSGEDIDHSYPYNDVGDIDGDDITGALNYSQTKTMLDKLGHNTALFYPSEAFHQLDENLIITNDVEIYNIVGSGLPTVGQIIEKYTTNIFGETVSHKDQIFINGDETVPLMSASLIDYGKSHSLLGDAIIYYTKQEHGDLVASGSALLLVRNILNDDNSLPKDVSITPYNFNGTIVSGHSPINISVYDNSGNHTGLTDNGDIEINIPGSFYDTLDDAKFIYLPDEGTYSIKVEATDRGSFDLKIRKFENSANTVTTLYVNVPLTANTKAETVLDTSTGTPSILKLDENGDGTFEQDINYEDASTPTPIPTNSPSSGASSSLFSDQNNQNQIAQAISLSPTGVSIEDSISTVGEVAGAKTFGPIAESQKANSPNKNKSIAIVVLIGSVVAIMGLLRFKNRGKRVTS